MAISQIQKAEAYAAGFLDSRMEQLVEALTQTYGVSQEEAWAVVYSATCKYWSLHYLGKSALFGDS